jgi:carbamoylphosphate synthase large subunit
VPRYDFSGVITASSGPPIVTTACIAEVFNLPGISPEAAKTTTFKSQLMTACAELGIPAPSHQAVHSLREINWAEIEYPCVIKPSLGLVGKLAIRVVHSRDELESQFEQTLTAAWDGCVEIESFVPGHDVALIAMVANRELLPVALIDEVNTFDSNGYVQTKHFALPSMFAGGTEEELIHRLARDIVEGIGIETSPISMSCRCEHGGQPRLIEIQLDLGAHRVLDKLLPTSSDFDFREFAIRILTGQKPTTTPPVLRPSSTIPK